MTDPSTPRPWHREPMVWLVLGIPATAVVMGVVMLVVSGVSYDGLVADDYYRRGMEINRSLARDRAATAVGIEGRLRVVPAEDMIVAELTAREGFKPPARLLLSLHHATRSGRDRELVLERTAPLTYAGPWHELGAGNWNVELSAAGWRITGRFAVPGAPTLLLRYQDAGDDGG